MYINCSKRNIFRDDQSIAVNTHLIPFYMKTVFIVAVTQLEEYYPMSADRQPLTEKISRILTTLAG